MIERWLVAIRDHPNRPPPAQFHVLTMLAIRMAWKSGTGYASAVQLAADADVSEPTARRATTWARKTRFLIMTRRGHRLGSGQVVASEWKLTRPVDNSSQQVTGERLTEPQPLNGHISTDQQDDLNRSAETPHQESSTSKTSSSVPRTTQARGGLATIDPTVTEEEINQVHRILADRGAKAPAAVLHAEIAKGNGYKLLGEARHDLERASWQRDEPRMPSAPDLSTPEGTQRRQQQLADALTAWQQEHEVQP